MKTINIFTILTNSVFFWHISVLPRLKVSCKSVSWWFSCWMLLKQFSNQHWIAISVVIFDTYSERQLLICFRMVTSFPFIINPLSTNPTQWSNTLKQFFGKSRWIFWVCLTILWGWRFKVKSVTNYYLDCCKV